MSKLWSRLLLAPGSERGSIPDIGAPLKILGEWRAAFPVICCGWSQTNFFSAR